MRDIEKVLDLAPMESASDVKNYIDSAKEVLSQVEGTFNNVFMRGDDQRFYDDFEEVRETLKGVINEFRGSISKLSMIALDTEKAAHFAALSQMTTTLLNANKQLLEIYAAKKKYYDVTKATQPTEQAAAPININNAVFTGTTQDLKKWIEDFKKN